MENRGTASRLSQGLAIFWESELIPNHCAAEDPSTRGKLVEIWVRSTYFQKRYFIHIITCNSIGEILPCNCLIYRVERKVCPLAVVDEFFDF